MGMRSVLHAVFLLFLTILISVVTVVSPAEADPLAPVISAISDSSVYEGETYTGPTPSLTQGTVPITWSLVEGPAGMTIDPATGVVTWPSAGTAGDIHVVTIQAANSEGSDLESWLIVVVEEPVNLALNKPSSQSSLWAADVGPENGNDGDTTGTREGGSIICTNPDSQAWWEVDLQAVYDVSQIDIWNRTDSNNAERLFNFYVIVSENPFQSQGLEDTLAQTGVWAHKVTGIAGRPSSLRIDPIRGRYVRIQLEIANYLNLAEVEVWGSSTPSLSNVALNKPATMSSTRVPEGSADKANDGETSGAWAGGSVTCSNSDAQAWWEVDLQGVYDISQVFVYNRTDPTYTARLSNFYLLVSEAPFQSQDLAETLAQPGVWAQHVSGICGSPTSFATGTLRGRYVRVQLAGTNFLHIAEVIVRGTPAFIGSNIALDKPSTMSSTRVVEGGPEKANDGDVNGSWYGGSVTCSNSDPQAWWEVDLGGSYEISQINVWNRTDIDEVNNYPARLTNFHIMISDEPFLSQGLAATLAQEGVWHQNVPGQCGTPTTLQMGAVRGRYVRVQLTGTNFLHIAEVQVFGVAALPLPPFVAEIEDQAIPEAVPYTGPTPNLNFGSEPVVWSLVQGPSGMTIDSATGVVGWASPVTTQSPYTITVRAVNATGFDDESWSLIVNQAVAPVIGEIGDDNATNVEVYTGPTPLLIQGTDPITWSLVEGPSGMTIDAATGEVTWPSPDCLGGPYEVTIRAENSAGSDEASWLVSVTAVAFNVALNKPSSQSSLWAADVGPEKGNDGDITGTREGGICTNPDPQAWWEVDLQDVYAISQINIWNRTDSNYDERLTNFYVIVSEEPFQSQALEDTLSQDGVWVHKVTGKGGRPSSLRLNPIRGRYVRIQMEIANFLNFAEVEVFAIPTLPFGNVALNKPASMSSTRVPEGSADRSNDGDTNGEWSGGSVTCTNADAQAWWEVDLRGVYEISRIDVWNRTDTDATHNYPARLTNFYVFVSEAPLLSQGLNETLAQNGVHAIHVPGQCGVPTTIALDGIHGRYVRVQLVGTNFLHLAEVEVFGMRPPILPSTNPPP